MSMNPFTAFRWEWNINTVVVLVGFGAGLIAYGGQQQTIKATVERSVSNELTLREIDRRLSTAEFEQRAMLRNNEQVSKTLAETQAALQTVIADLRVIREISTRMEQRLDRQPSGVQP